MNPYSSDIDYTGSINNTNTDRIRPEDSWSNYDESPAIEHDWQFIDERVIDQLPPGTVNRVDPTDLCGTWSGHGMDGVDNNPFCQAFLMQVDEIDQEFMDTYC